MFFSLTHHGVLDPLGLGSDTDCSSGQCPAGTYQVTNTTSGLIVCEDCPQGYYSALSGQSSCTKCDDALGNTTLSTGATYCDACIAG